MRHLVTLDINTPVAAAFPQREIGVVRQRLAGAVLRLVPRGLHDPDFRVPYPLDQRQRPIRSARHVHNDFIAQRQQRTDGRHERIAQPAAISNEGESADFHFAMTA